MTAVFQEDESSTGRRGEAWFLRPQEESRLYSFQILLSYANVHVVGSGRGGAPSYLTTEPLFLNDRYMVGPQRRA